MKKEGVIRGWDALSEYLHGISTRTLRRYADEGIIPKHKLGSQVFFYKKEIDNSIIEQ